MTASDPLKATFAFQRMILESGQRSVAAGADAQRRAGELTLEMISTQNALQREAVRQARVVSEAAVSVGEGSVPAGEEALGPMRESMEAGFDAALDTQEAVSHAIEEATRDGLDQTDAMNEEVSEAMQEAFELFLEAHSEFEEQSLTAAEEMFGRFRPIPVEE